MKQKQQRGVGFFSFRGPFWRALEWWGRHQLWSWFIIALFFAVWVSFDLGNMIARASMANGMEGPVRGSLTIDEVLAHAQALHGGRLVVISEQEARFIDPAGQVWGVPHFASDISHRKLDSIEALGVAMDGQTSINIAPFKTRPRDLVLASLTDVFVKLWVFAIYGVIAYVLFRQFGYGKKARFNRVNDEERAKVKLADVAGMEGPKKEVAEIVEYLRDPEKFKKLGARPPRGVLMVGPPGNGKTMLAKAIAGEANAAFLEQSGSTFVEIYVGEGAKSVRRLFDEARRLAPCLIFIDEIDAIGASRDIVGSHEERIQSINALLTEMDGFQENTGVVVIAATNRQEVLDAALLRPGRFDRKVYIPLPSKRDRRDILAVHTNKLPSCNIDVDRWAARTAGFSGADLAALVNEAAVEAARSDLDSVEDRCMILARERILMGPRNLGQQHSEKDRRIIAFHEIGHAVLQIKTGGVVEKVSILPRGRALGVTLTETVEDQVLQSEEDVRRQLLVLMGGRASEREFLGSITGGAADDMQRASAIARQAVRWLGLDGSPYTPEHQELVLEQERIAQEWVVKAYEDACQILRASEQEIRAVAEELVLVEEIEGEVLMLRFKEPPAA
jgi:cell division protease FtsH